MRGYNALLPDETLECKFEIQCGNHGIGRFGSYGFEIRESVRCARDRAFTFSH